MRLRRRHQTPNTCPPPLDMSVGDLVHQLDSLVDRLQTETTRLEAANDHAATALQDRSDR